MSNMKELLNIYAEQSGALEQKDLYSALRLIKQRIELAEKINTTMKTLFAEVKMGAFILCPQCKSETLLEFSACHLCSYQLLDSVAPENVKPVEQLPLEKAINKALVAPNDLNGMVDMGIKIAEKILADAEVSKAEVDPKSASILKEIETKKADKEVSKVVEKITEIEEAPAKRRGRPAKVVEEKAVAPVKEKTVKAKKEKVVVPDSELDDEDLIDEPKKAEVEFPTPAEILDMGQSDLQKTNLMLKLNIDLKALKITKLTQFREAVMEAVANKVMEDKAVEKEKELKSKVKPEVVETNKDVAKKGPKVVEVTEEDFIDDDDAFFEEEDAEAHIPTTSTPVSDEEALQDEADALNSEIDFDLDEIEVDDIDFDEE